MMTAVLLLLCDDRRGEAAAAAVGVKMAMTPMIGARVAGAACTSQPPDARPEQQYSEFFFRTTFPAYNQRLLETAH